MDILQYMIKIGRPYLIWFSCRI